MIRDNTNMKHSSISLTDDEVALLHKKIDEIATPDEIRNRCRVLLCLDVAHEPVLSYADIEKELNVSHKTISNVKKYYKEGGIDYILHRKKRDSGAAAAHFADLPDYVVNALHNYLSKPSEKDNGRWSLRLLTKAVNDRFPNNPVSRRKITEYIKEHRADFPDYLRISEDTPYKSCTEKEVFKDHKSSDRPDSAGNPVSRIESPYTFFSR